MQSGLSETQDISRSVANNPGRNLPWLQRLPFPRTKAMGQAESRPLGSSVLY